MSKCVQSKLSKADSCNVPLLSSLLPFFPLFLIYYHACIIISVHLSLFFLLSPLGTFLLSPFLSLSSTLCSFHRLYENSLVQTSLIIMANKITFSSRQFSILYRGNTEFISFLQLRTTFLIIKATLQLTSLMWKNGLSNWGLLSKKSYVGELTSFCQFQQLKHCDSSLLPPTLFCI